MDTNSVPRSREAARTQECPSRTFSADIVQDSSTGQSSDEPFLRALLCVVLVDAALWGLYEIARALPGWIS